MTVSVPTQSQSRLTVVLALLLTAMLAGCGGNSTKPVVPAAGSKGLSQQEQFSLDGPMAGLQPEEFEFNVPRDLPATELNNWAHSMLADLVDQDIDDAKFAAALKPFLDPATVERALRRSFVPRDSAAIRDAYWAREIVEVTAKDVPNDVDRVVQLFYFVTHNMRLIADSKVALPLAPFDSMLLGKGTANDRAWAFAVLLQQLRITAVIVDPVSDAAATDTATDTATETATETASQASAPVLVGVLCEGGLRMFDMRLGLPLPSSNDDVKRPLVTSPATLQQLAENDALLRQFDASNDAPYLLRAEQLKQVKLSIIADSSSWSRRMEALQNGLAGSKGKSLFCFQPLASVGQYDGVLENVAKELKGLVAPDRIGVWSYPEQQREAREHLSPEQSEERIAALTTFQAPRPLIVTVEMKGDQQIPKLEFQRGQNLHLSSRLKHILGQYDVAIPQYLKTQGWRRFPPSARNRVIESRDGGKSQILPPAPNAIFVTPDIEEQLVSEIPQEIRELHGRAAEEAMYWRGGCQLSLGQYKTAAEDFEAFLVQVRSSSSLNTSARYLAGVAAALDDRTSRGAAFLRKIDQDDPNYRAARFLIRRWTEADAKAEPSKDVK